MNTNPNNQPSGSELAPSLQNAGPYWDVSESTFVQPNRLQGQFLVTRFDVVWAADVLTLKFDDMSRGKPVRKQMHIFTVSDLGDGRVVLVEPAEKMTANLIVTSLTFELEKLRYRRGDTEPLLIHTDRGGHFTSHAFYNLQFVFPFVLLSHSAPQVPTDNSVVERVQRTLYRNKRFFGYFGVDPAHAVFSSAEQCQEVIRKVVDRYNTTFVNERSLGLTPINANWAFRWAADVGLKEPMVEICLKPIEGEEEVPEGSDDILTYREQVRRLAQTQVFCPPRDLAMAAMQASRTYKLTTQELNTKALAESKAAMEQLNDKLDLLLKQTQPRVKQRRPRANRPILRTAMQVVHVEALSKWATQLPVTADRLRNVICALMLYGTGCRVSEIHQVTWKQATQLLHGNSAYVMNSKRNRTERKVMADDVAAVALVLFNQLIDFLKQMGYHFKDEDAFVSDFALPRGKPLNVTYFTTAMNKELAAFSEAFNKEFQTSISLKTHSGRVGFVTTLRASGMDFKTISELVGHEDLRSTTAYDKFVLTEQQVKDAINRGFKRGSQVQTNNPPASPSHPREPARSDTDHARGSS